MLKTLLHLTTFGAFLIVAGFIGLFLWQALYATEKIGDGSNQNITTQSEQQHTNERLNMGSRPPNHSNATEQAIADYTKWLAIFTAFLVLATIGLFVSGERNIEIARLSANAANKSAEIAERALIAGQRAFVSVAYYEPSAVMNITTNKSKAMNIITKEVKAWALTPIWQNSGDTPTRNMQNHINIHISDDLLPNDWDFPDLWPANTTVQDRLPTPLGIAPKGTIRGQAVGGISVDQIREIAAGTKRLYMWGWATHNDVFPQTPIHVTRFAVQIVAGGDPTDKDKMSFSFRFIHNYNCSDDECEHQGYPAWWKPREISEK